MRDKRIRTNLQFIYHTLHEVNEKLKDGQYFFFDIVRDGVLLYELKDATLSGYVRYSEHYRITKEELEGQIIELMGLVNAACVKHLKELKLRISAT